MIIARMEDLLMKSFLLFKSRWKNITLAGAFFYGVYLISMFIPLLIFYFVLDVDPSYMSSPEPTIGMMVFSVVYFFWIIIFSFLAFFISLIIYDQLICSQKGIRRTVIQSFLETLPRYLPFMGTTYVATFMILPLILPGLVVMAVTSFGFYNVNAVLLALFFISILVYMAGIYLGTSFTSLAQTASICERKDVQTTLKTVFGIIKKTFWKWIGRYLLFQLIMGAAVSISFIILIPSITGVTLLNIPEAPFINIPLAVRITGSIVAGLISFVILLAILVFNYGMIQSFNLLHYQDLKARSEK